MHFPRLPRPSGLPALLVLVAIGVVGADASASITGVCPDGSYFIVKTSDSIPCREAKQVAPEDLPPIRPQYLPRPYAWEAFHRRNDPNNPYNLVDSEPAVRADAGGTGRPQEPAPEALPAVEAPPPRTAPEAAPQSAQPPRSPAGLALSEREVRDLHLIVELSQQQTPATFRDGPGVTLRLAHSQSFEPRVQRALGSGGPVLLFAAEAADAAEFHPNLTFVQGHLAFHPDPDNDSQLGVIDGITGALDPGQTVLGYVVLPESVDLGQPLDIYWDDHRLSATLRR